MTEFVVRLENRPGALARLTELLGEAGINIEALAAWGMDGEGIVRLVVDDAEGCARVLSDAGLDVARHRVLVASLRDRPGELGRVTRRLADAGINIDAVYVLGTGRGAMELALAVDDPDDAAPHLPVRGSASA